jgi:hypothetical protein
MSSPTSRTLKYLRDDGHIADVVEQWNSFTHTRKDLFGFIDILSVKDGKVYGWQATSTGNMRAREKKILESEIYPAVAEAMSILVIGWKKYAKPVKRKYWRETIITVD